MSVRSDIKDAIVSKLEAELLITNGGPLEEIVRRNFASAEGGLELAKIYDDRMPIGFLSSGNTEETSRTEKAVPPRPHTTHVYLFLILFKSQRKPIAKEILDDDAYDLVVTAVQDVEFTSGEMPTDYELHSIDLLGSETFDGITSDSTIFGHIYSLEVFAMKNC